MHSYPQLCGGEFADEEGHVVVLGCAGGEVRGFVEECAEQRNGGEHGVVSEAGDHAIFAPLLPLVGGSCQDLA